MKINFAKGINFRVFADEFMGLLLPVRCGACSQPLVRSEKCLCTKCLRSLPRTNSHQRPCRLLEEKVYGRVPLEPVLSFLVFSRFGMTREMLHHIKYEGGRRLARQAGSLYAAETGFGESLADMLIPVPLHWRRAWHRGFNQAEYFAKGFSDVSGIPLDTTILYRNSALKSQTVKRREERWERMQGSFMVRNNHLLQGKRVLLVDDVITTGSTLASGAEELYSAGAACVGILTLAVVE